jgi:hypothetical protein
MGALLLNHANNIAASCSIRVGHHCFNATKIWPLFDIRVSKAAVAAGDSKPLQCRQQATVLF